MCLGLNWILRIILSILFILLIFSCSTNDKISIKKNNTKANSKITINTGVGITINN